MAGRRLALVGLLLAAPATWAATVSGGRCTARKVKAVGVDVRSALECHAVANEQGIPLDDGCLAAAATTLHGAFVAAESRGGCLTSGDAVLIEQRFENFAADVLAFALDSYGPGCVAAKIRATAGQTKAKLGCVAARRKGSTRRCFAKADAKFTARLRHATRTVGCTPGSGTADVDAQIDAFVLDVVSLLESPSTSTTTIVSTSSTSITGVSTTITSVSSTTATTEPLPPVSFSAAVQPIFTSHCAIAGCHTGSLPQAGLDLSPGKAHGSLVGVASRECPRFLLVAAGAPDASYLLFKLDGAGPCFGGSPMPSGLPPLSADDKAAISSWIAEGAADN